MKFMLKFFCTVFFFTICCLPGLASAQSANKSADPKITKAEMQEAQDLAKNFTLRFIQTKDIKPLLDEFYFSDFIDRYKLWGSKEDNKSVNNIFVPGLSYHYRVISEGSSEDWRKFYIASHNFILLGFVASLGNAKDNPSKEADFDLAKFYSPQVIALLDKNPNLANMIKNEGQQKTIDTADEMRNVTATLEQALAIVREKHGSSPLLTINDNELTKVFKKDYFKPHLQLADDEEFGFPTNTRFLIIKTPIAMQLMLAKEKDKLKIVYATLSLD